MLTRPSAFSAHQFALAGERHIIISLDDGTDTYLISDCEMHLSDGHVYAILADGGFSGVEQGFDIFTKDWIRAEAEITLSNLPYMRNSSSEWVRIADQLSDIINGTMIIYFAAGPNVASLSDCLTYFTGIIIESPEYNESELTIRAIDNSRIYNAMLPQNYYDNAKGPQEKYPIAYGEFTAETSGDYQAGLGLARVVTGSPNQSTWYYSGIIDEGSIKSTAGDLYFNLGGSFPTLARLALALTEVGGKTTFAAQGIESYCLEYFYLNDSPPSDYDVSTLLPGSSANAHDGDGNTQSTISDNITDDGYGNTQEGQGCWGITNQDILVDHFRQSSGDYIDVDNPPNLHIRQKNIDWNNVDPIVGVVDHIKCLLYYSRDGSSDHYVTMMDLDSSGDLDSSTWVEYVGKGVSNFSSPFDTELMASIYVIDAASNEADGVLDNDTMVSVGELELVLKIYLTAIPPEAWTAVQGRMFGSWIDDGGRSNSYDENDLIEDPAFIIESILRDELSLTNSDIDTASFDDAANSSVVARMNLHSKNEMTSNDAIKKLSEQSTFAFMWTSGGKARLIPLNDSSPTTATRGSHPVIVPYSHIQDGRIQVSKTATIINMLNIESRWQGEYGRYRDNDAVENSTSQTNYGTGAERTMDMQWPNICGSSLTHVSNHLVGNSNGIWANPHIQINFKMVGFTGSDIEPGDWIELDDTTIDPHIKCFGSTWSAKQFLVVDVIADSEGTEITAIELYG